MYRRDEETQRKVQRASGRRKVILLKEEASPWKKDLKTNDAKPEKAGKSGH